MLVGNMFTTKPKAKDKLLQKKDERVEIQFNKFKSKPIQQKFQFVKDLIKRNIQIYDYLGSQTPTNIKQFIKLTQKSLLEKRSQGIDNKVNKITTTNFSTQYQQNNNQSKQNNKKQITNGSLYNNTSYFCGTQQIHIQKLNKQRQKIEKQLIVSEDKNKQLQRKIYELKTKIQQLNENKQQNISSINSKILKLKQKILQLKQESVKMAKYYKTQIKQCYLFCVKSVNGIQEYFYQYLTKLNSANQQKNQKEKLNIIRQICFQLSDSNLENSNKNSKYKQITSSVKKRIQESVKNKEQQLFQKINGIYKSINDRVNNLEGSSSPKKEILNETFETNITKSQQQGQQILNLILKKSQELCKTSNFSDSFQEYIYGNPAICFFNSNILPIMHTKTQQQSKNITQLQNFIINSVNGLYKKNKKVKALRYLYGFQHMRKTKVNFHCLVDNHPNLLLIIKLKNQVLIGAFTQSGLISKTDFSPSNRSTGFLFQSKNKKIFSVRQKYKNNAIMPYDDFYILIGNYDIKIRMESEVVESCFGSQTSLFRPNSQYNYDNILHSGKDVSQTQLEDYQFYQLIIF